MRDSGLETRRPPYVRPNGKMGKRGVHFESEYLFYSVLWVFCVARYITLPAKVGLSTEGAAIDICSAKRLKR